MIMSNVHRSLTILDEDGEGYDDYVATTIHTGNMFLVIAIVVSMCSLLALPLTVAIWRRCLRPRRREEPEQEWEIVSPTNEDVNDGRGFDVMVDTPFDSPIKTEDDDSHELDSPPSQETNESSGNAFLLAFHTLVRWRKRGGRAESVDRRREHVSRGVNREGRHSMFRATTNRERRATDDPSASFAGTVVQATGARKHPPTQPSPSRITKSNQSPTASHGKATSPTVQRAPRGSRRRRCSSVAPADVVPILRQPLRFFLALAKYDNETKRILRLAVPFTVTAIVKTTSELVKLGVLSYNLGTNSMIAYALVDMVVGISSALVGGWVEALSSLGSMAYGAENHPLVGQYLQLSCLFYVLCQIPFVVMWSFVMDDIMLLLGYDQDVANIAQKFAWTFVAVEVMRGINVAYYDFLELIEREAYANVINCMEEVFDLGFVTLLAMTTEATLPAIGLVMLLNSSVFLLVNVVITSCKGWTEPFEFGMIGQLALKNKPAVRQMVKTATPLAFGSLLAYAEWELLTVFAAMLGQAEASTWAILGFVWDVFEATTEAIGDASEVRVAYQLGKGRPDMAKLSAYKSIFIASIVTFSVTAVFLSLRDVLPTWLTDDRTLRYMLAELIPLVGLGNITMNMGMVCWALIGAQARYRLATSIAMACSLLVTLPLGAMFTVWLRFDLQGLTFAVVVGYTVTAMLLSTVLLLSDWETLSRNIQEEHGDASSSSSSSSSSSDSEELIPKDLSSQGEAIEANLDGPIPGEGGLDLDDAFLSSHLHTKIQARHGEDSDSDDDSSSSLSSCSLSSCSNKMNDANSLHSPKDRNAFSKASPFATGSPRCESQLEETNEAIVSTHHYEPQCRNDSMRNKEGLGSDNTCVNAWIMSQYGTTSSQASASGSTCGSERSKRSVRSYGEHAQGDGAACGSVDSKNSKHGKGNSTQQAGENIVCMNTSDSDFAIRMLKHNLYSEAGRSFSQASIASGLSVSSTESLGTSESIHDDGTHRFDNTRRISSSCSESGIYARSSKLDDSDHGSTKSYHDTPSSHDVSKTKTLYSSLYCQKVIVGRRARIGSVGSPRR